jgi:hypothetical protein
MIQRDSDVTATVLRERTRLGVLIRRRVGDPSGAEDSLKNVFHEFVQAYRLSAPIEQVSRWLFAWRKPHYAQAAAGFPGRCSNLTEFAAMDRLRGMSREIPL